jgi:lipopolysaccharide biosynthesis glycosyltransferase
MYKIFIGFDERQPVSFNVLQQSIIAQASEPVAIIPLRISQLPLKRTGLTPFTWSRFLVPYLCNYEGIALFLDVDIILNGDICELIKLAGDKAVYVSKNEHRFEWASVMLFNCSHEDNKKLTPEFIETADGLHGINWTQEIGDLPREWNHLVGYDSPKDAKLIHYTQGIPAYPETIESEHSALWHKWQRITNYSEPWEKLMGDSVHAVNCSGKKLPKFLFDLEKCLPKAEHNETVKKLMSG